MSNDTIYIYYLLSHVTSKGLKHICVAILIVGVQSNQSLHVQLAD